MNSMAFKRGDEVEVVDPYTDDKIQGIRAGIRGVLTNVDHAFCTVYFDSKAIDRPTSLLAWPMYFGQIRLVNAGHVRHEDD